MPRIIETVGGQKEDESEQAGGGVTWTICIFKFEFFFSAPVAPQIFHTLSGLSSCSTWRLSFFCSLSFFYSSRSYSQSIFSFFFLTSLQYLSLCVQYISFSEVYIFLLSISLHLKVQKRVLPLLYLYIHIHIHSPTVSWVFLSSAQFSFFSFLLLFFSSVYRFSFFNFSFLLFCLYVSTVHICTYVYSIYGSASLSILLHHLHDLQNSTVSISSLYL